MKLKLAVLYVNYLVIVLSFVCALYLRFKYPKLTQTEFLIEYWPLYAILLLSLVGAMSARAQVDALKKARNENLPR